MRYEIAISLLSNDIVWINGPFCPGDWNDLEIFRHSLLHELEVGERIAADDIYIGEAPTYVICAASCTTNEEKLKIHKRIEGRHESINKHIKNWGCLKKPFVGKGTPIEKMNKHGNMFRACAVMKQVAMEMGVGELYDV